MQWNQNTIASVQVLHPIRTQPFSFSTRRDGSHATMSCSDNPNPLGSNMSHYGSYSLNIQIFLYTIFTGLISVLAHTYYACSFIVLYNITVGAWWQKQKL